MNISNVDPKKLAALRDYLDLGYRLGLMLAQYDRKAAKACRVQYRGEVASKDTKLITATIAAGLLNEALEQDINIVNAEALLRERGIELVEQSRTDMGAFSSVIQVELVSESQTYKAAGTIFGQNMTRLVQLNEFRLDAFLDGILMVFSHRDVPGIIGTVGTIFGAHDVNIAQMTVGRASHEPGGPAIGVLNLDNLPPQAALDEVRANPDILSATIIQLPPSGELPTWLSGSQPRAKDSPRNNFPVLWAPHRASPATGEGFSEEVISR